MSAPKEGAVRGAAVAGVFYPSDPADCREYAAKLLVEHEADARRWSGKPGIGAIVPHAGWICSGAIAGCSLTALQASGATPDVVVVFGAVHTPIRLERAALDSSGRWSVPTGEAGIARDVRDRIGADSDLFVTDERFHKQEHAVEVELPLIALAWPGATLLPVEVPLIDAAAQIGIRTAQALQREKRSAVFLASSDLTHYGPAYRFAPVGVGLHGLMWARQNDRKLLDRIQQYDVNGIVEEVRSNANACGGGAIAAMLAACREFGASEATVLRHTDSYQVLSRLGRDDPSSAVGYASVVVR